VFNSRRWRSSIYLILANINYTSGAGANFIHVYLFRRRFALAFARRRQGASSEDIDALPPLEIRANPESAAASGFSLTIRRYSAGKQSFCAISKVRRMTVSHERSNRSVIMTGPKADSGACDLP
jgi:hypothetical protein